MNFPRRSLLLFLLLLAGMSVVAGAAEKEKPSVPPPDLANVPYGPHPRHVLDVWRAHSAEPTPLVVYIHGGGFRSRRGAADVEEEQKTNNPGKIL